VRKRPTEVPTQYGPVIGMAEKHGLKLPLVEELVSAIRQLETGAISMDEEHLFALDRKAAAR
jgi:2-dehydropantoate 2-reductase